MTGIGETVGTVLLVTAGVVAVAEGVNETAKLLNETVNTADEMFTTMGDMAEDFCNEVSNFFDSFCW